MCFCFFFIQMRKGPQKNLPRSCKALLSPRCQNNRNERGEILDKNAWFIFLSSKIVLKKLAKNNIDFLCLLS